MARRNWPSTGSSSPIVLDHTRSVRNSRNPSAAWGDAATAWARLTNGALRSSARDLITWNDALFRGAVVSPDLVKAMTTPARLNDGRLASENRVDMDAAESHGEYGFGLRIGQLDNHREIGHEGDIFGFNAVLDTYPDDDRLTIVVLANTPAGAFGLEKQIASIFLTSAPH